MKSSLIAALTFGALVFGFMSLVDQKSEKDELKIIQAGIKKDATAHVICQELTELLANKRLLNTQNEAESFVVAMNECFNFVKTKDLSDIYNK